MIVNTADLARELGLQYHGNDDFAVIQSNTDPIYKETFHKLELRHGKYVSASDQATARIYEIKRARNTSMHLTIDPIDELNPGFGYTIKIEKNGVVMIHTSTNPTNGNTLTYADCLNIAKMY